MNYHPVEEKWNAITHLAGLALALIGSIQLLFFSIKDSNTIEWYSALVYCLSLISLYAASGFYHAINRPRLKKLFQLLDHLSIFLLIAGTYTPVVLIGIGGEWGWGLFFSVWTLVVAGFIVKLFAFEKSEKVALFLYILMGWLIVVAAKPLFESIPLPAIALIAIGGLLYTSGIYFYLKEHIRFNHAIWHLFVLGGSLFHFLAIQWYIFPG